MWKLLLLLFWAVLFVPSGINAQRTGRHTKEKGQKSPERINVYRKKTIVFRFTRPEYLHFRDSINKQTKDALHKISDHKIEWRPAQQKTAVVAPPKEFLTGNDFSIYRDDNLLCFLDPAAYLKFKDSVSFKTKDTLFVDAWNRVDIHPYRHMLKPDQSGSVSKYIFINHKGYVAIALPLAKTKKYRVVFFDSDGTELFEIKAVKETELILDKTNFMHAGWFSFELYEEEVLKEKKRLFLPKD